MADFCIYPRVARQLNDGAQEGITAVLTASTTDVLSHVAIRARSQGVLLATCYDATELEGLKARKGEQASLARLEVASRVPDARLVDVGRVLAAKNYQVTCLGPAMASKCGCRSDRGGAGVRA